MFDLDAAYAAMRDAAGDPFEFTYGGEKFEMSLSVEWPIEVSTMIASNQLVPAMELVLGVRDPEQAQRFIALHPSFGHVQILFEQEQAHEGAPSGLPNSAASQRRASTPT